MNTLRRKKGVTLIELIVALAILGIVIIGVSSFIMFSNKTFNISEKQSDAQFNVRFASESITKELRVADTIEILDNTPAEFESDKKYIYVEGNSIKLFMGGYKKIILKGSSNFTPTLTFKKKSGNGKVLNFTIDGLEENQKFKIDSDILILNMPAPNSILGEDSGSVVAFGPFTNPEIVQVDKALLNLLTLNKHLTTDAAGSYILPPPPVIDYIRLQDIGENESQITWSSSNTDVIESNGIVKRPGINEGDAVVTLTATLTKDDENESKAFNVIVCDMDPMDIGNLPPPDGVVGEAYNHSLDAIGGNGVYTFTEASIGYGLFLDSGGHITGTPTRSGTVNFTVILKDSIENRIDKNVSLTIN